MAEQLGFENPQQAVGAKLDGFYVPLEVRGVIENHHHNSLHHDYDPIAYILSSWTDYYFVKFSDKTTGTTDPSKQLISMINTVKNNWSEAFADYPIEYFFLDQAFNKQYESDERFGKIFATFAGLAILIASLGLFGLTAFILQQKTKEIGIRKVLGAGIGQLVVLLSKNYLLMIMVAYVLSMPAAWYGLNQWLNNYHFRITIGWWLFVIPLGIVFIVALLTITSKLLKTVRNNPIDSLRYE